MRITRRIHSVDPKLEAEGVWFEYGDGSSDKPPRYKLGGNTLNNPRYVAAIKKHLGGFAEKSTIGADEEIENAMKLAFVEGCMFAWENIVDDNGAAIPLTLETGLAHINDPANIHIAADMRVQVTRSANFRKA